MELFYEEEVGSCTWIMIMLVIRSNIWKERNQRISEHKVMS